MNDKQKQQIEALAAVAECATDKEVLDKDDVKDINVRLDNILASMSDGKKFFKRLL